MEKYNREIDWDDCEYSGTVNGCTVFLIAIYDSGISSVPMKVADCVFEWPTVFKIYVYRSGEVCKLKEAYEKGWLTETHIREIHKEHVEQEKVH